MKEEEIDILSLHQFILEIFASEEQKLDIYKNKLEEAKKLLKLELSPSTISRIKLNIKNLEKT